MLNVRPFDWSDDDYEASVAIWNAIWPDEPSSVEGSRYRDSILDSKFLFERLMAHFESVWSREGFSRPVPEEWLRTSATTRNG